MKRQVVVVAYDPDWPQRFAAEVAHLRTILGDEIVNVHHIGSTAVPGLAAKPIIDILLEVQVIERIDNYNNALRANGYVARGEYGLPGRRYFPKEKAGARVAHVHAWQHGHPEIKRHLALRDYLRANPAEAHAYALVKIDLARRFPSSIDDYMAGKDAFVKELEQRALTWGQQR